MFAGEPRCHNDVAELASRRTSLWQRCSRWPARAERDLRRPRQQPRPLSPRTHEALGVASCGVLVRAPWARTWCALVGAWARDSADAGRRLAGRAGSLRWWTWFLGWWPRGAPWLGLARAACSARMTVVMFGWMGGG